MLGPIDDFFDRAFIDIFLLLDFADARTRVG
jgi:hypothetical protein